jgi:aryl-alcohol dehydrogenase-like predicted oxidoreductase
MDGAGAQRAIHTALDAGINHFDLARSYELGAAERLVGRVVRGRREQVILVTKFGLWPRPWAWPFQPLKPIIRRLRAARTQAQRPHSPAPPPPAIAGRLVSARWQYRRLPMTAASMQTSLEASLRALGTSYVDILLMHEPPVIERWEELQACAADLKRAGKIRGWGLACEGLPGVAERQKLDVLQVSCGSVRTNADNLGRGLVLFSPLRGIADHEVDARLKGLWSEFPQAVVVCSMSSPEHIRANAVSAGLERAALWGNDA